MQISKKQADDIYQKLLFAVGCLRVVAQAPDRAIREERLQEAENNIADAMDIVEALKK